MVGKKLQGRGGGQAEGAEAGVDDEGGGEMREERELIWGARVRVSFGGFCGDNMGEMEPKTLNIRGSILKKKSPALGD